MIEPVNLIDELDRQSSGSYVRRVMARTLMHSGLDPADARDIWTTAELGTEMLGTGLWGRYIRMIFPA